MPDDIKYRDLALAMTMGDSVLSPEPCQDCGCTKSLKYGAARRCFSCWEKHIEPKKKSFNKKETSK